MADQCLVAGTDGDVVPGPSCRSLLEDFAAVMADRTRWPTHVCVETAWAATDAWLMASGICRWWGTAIAEDVRKTLDDRWPYWPLAVGRLGFMALFSERLPLDGLPVPIDLARKVGMINWVAAALPLDGVEEVLFAVRLTSPGLTVDFLGLRRPVQGSAGSMIGGWHVNAAGADVGRETTPTETVRTTLTAAREWWSTFEGQSIGGGGRIRLEDDPESGWLLIAEQAEAMKRKNRWMLWRAIARNFEVSERMLRDYRRRRRELLRRT